MITRTLYGLRPAIVFEASVHILRGNTQSAKEVVNGNLTEFPGTQQLLGIPSESPDDGIISWTEGKNTFVPKNIDHFFERTFLQMNLTCPERLTFLGFLEQAGIKSHNGYLEDSPSEQHEQILKLSNDYIISAVQDASKWGTLTSDQEDSLKILKWSVENCNRNFRDHIYTVEQLDGIHSLCVILMSDFAIIEDLADVERYEARLVQIKKKFDLTVSDMQMKRIKGIMPPKVCLQKIARSIQGIIKDLSGENNAFITSVSSKFKTATKEELPIEATSRIQSKIREFVIPAYECLLKEVNVCLEVASDDPGVWKLPRGDEFYKHCLKWQTTTDYTPEHIHQLGLDKVKDLHAYVQRVVQGLNERGDMTLLATNSAEKNLKILSEDKAFQYEDSESGRKECIEDYRKLLDEISLKVRHMFNLVPSSKCVVKPMPNAMGEGGAGACYFIGSLDLSRPGMFYANLTNIKSQNKSQCKTLTAHEAVPGHHFQCSLQLENKQHPYFRRCMDETMFTAYIEGWGLYAEYIGLETGFYNDTDGNEGYSVLGYCAAELLRSARLVVDTGLHKMRWSRQQAVDYMMTSTGMLTQEAEDEVDRYCVLPGQACAYKIGQLKLLDIREKCEKNDPEFDIRKFHDRILHIGPVPLDILEELILRKC